MYGSAMGIQTVTAKLARLGPASQALERAAKRRRTEAQPIPTFDFDALFHAVTPASEECFPSIAWDLDDDSHTHESSCESSFPKLDPPSLRCPSLGKQKASSPLVTLSSIPDESTTGVSSSHSLMRSKTFKSSLCDLLAASDSNIVSKPSLLTRTTSSTRLRPTNETS